MRDFKFIATAAGISCALLVAACKKENQAQKTDDQETNSNSTPKLTTNSVVFNADASLRSATVWKDINVEQDGSVTTISDETGTLCWKFLENVFTHVEQETKYQ